MSNVCKCGFPDMPGTCPGWQFCPMQDTENGKKCDRCGEYDIDPVVEAFELSGQIVCEDCAQEVFDENSQFGMGA